MVKAKYLDRIAKILFKETCSYDWPQLVFPIYGEMQFGYSAPRNKTHAFLRYSSKGNFSKGAQPKWSVAMISYYGPDKLTKHGRHNLHCEETIGAEDIQYIMDIDEVIKEIEHDVERIRQKHISSLLELERIRVE